MEEMAEIYFDKGYKPLKLSEEMKKLVERFHIGICSDDEITMLMRVGRRDVKMQNAMRCYLLVFVHEGWPRDYSRVTAFDELMEYSNTSSYEKFLIKIL